jgi:hypothetical protein
MTLGHIPDELYPTGFVGAHGLGRGCDRAQVVAAAHVGNLGIECGQLTPAASYCASAT